MPEGPEIRRAADKIEKVLAGKRIEKCQVGLPSLKSAVRVLRQQAVDSIETRGKAMLTHFKNGFTIYSHNQLYGVWKVVKRGQMPQTNRQLRLALHTDTHSALLYSASDISLWRTEELAEHPFLARIGPDILDPKLSWRLVMARLQSKAFANCALSSSYLNQAFLAGLGNYLRSEILFCSRLAPDLKPRQLSRKQLGTLSRTTLSVSRRSYDSGGVTLSKREHTARLKMGERYGSARFFVFGREGKACRLCGSQIQRREANSRRIYFCSVCQPSFF